MKNARNLLILLAGITAFAPFATAATEENAEEVIVEENKRISKRLDDLAKEIDTLLSNRKGESDNETTLSLIGFFESREGGEWKAKPHLGVNLRLPKLEEKWRLRFSSYDNEDEFEGLGRNRDGATPREAKYGASVAFVRDLGKIKTQLRPRLELKDPLVSSFLLKFSSKIDLTFMDIQWRKKFFVHSIDGAGESLNLDFEKEIGGSSLFRFFNEAQYLDKDNIFRVSQGPSLRFRLNRDMALSNTFSLNSASRALIDDPTQIRGRAGSYHLSSYVNTLSFSHQILQRVFHYQVSPFLEFTKAGGFKGQAGINLRTEVIF